MTKKQGRLRNGLGVVLILTMCAVVGLLLERSRERAIDDLRRDTKNLTSALALYTRSIVASIDLALVGGRDSLALLQVTEPGPSRPELATEVLRSNVARIGLPVLMRVLDAQGYQRFSSDPQPYGPSSRDRDFFRAHVARDAGLYISQPFVSRINGKWAMVFSRRVNGPNGEFRGVILVGAPMELFESLFQRFELGTRGTLILADDDGILLARRPVNHDLVGKKVLREDGALGRLRSGVNAGVRIADAPVDGVSRMLGFERVGSTRLVVGVGQSVEDWLANWRREALASGTVTLLFGGLALLMWFRTTRHIQERKEAAERLALANRRLRDITDNLPLLVSYVDRDRRLRFCNATWKHWMGVDPASAIGRPLAEVIGATLYEQRRESLDRALGGERVSFDVESLAGGVNRFLYTEYIPDVQPDGSVAGIYAMSTDVTASKKVEIQLLDLAHVDSLTGLANRRRFEEKLHDAMARSKREQRPMALMFLDVDYFKRINDTHGHAGGDAVLREFARRLQRCTRATDTVARFAGDEFVVILEGLHAGDDAQLVARKIVAALRPPFALGAARLSVTSSIGVVIFNGENVPSDVVVAKADEALYRAKEAGRDTFVVSRVD